MLASYLRDKLGCEVTCQKLDTVQSWFSSFKATAECKEIAEMHDPKLWPEGAFVWCFYETQGFRRINIGRQLVQLNGSILTTLYLTPTFASES